MGQFGIKKDSKKLLIVYSLPQPIQACFCPVFALLYHNIDGRIELLARFFMKGC